MKNFIALALAGAVSAIPLIDIEVKFMGYMTQYGKSYGTIEEYAFRLEQFTRNYIAVVTQNAVTTSSYKLGYNVMSDWTEAEYSRRLTANPTPKDHKHPIIAVYDQNALANSVDWVAAGVVNAVKDQGQCGSCWAFSAAGALESTHMIKGGILFNFAEQQLVDCSTANYGCNGGWQYEAYNYYKTSKAMETIAYPYKAVDGTCKYSATANTGKGTTGYVAVSINNPDAMKAALAERPISVSVSASHSAWQYYESGILDSSKCGTRTDHAVIVTGWGVENGIEYWTVRNSWGTTWGEKGYIRLAITGNDAGICGVQTDPMYPLV